MRDDIDAEAGARHLVYRKRDTVDRDGALGGDARRQRRGRFEDQANGVTLRTLRHQPADAIDVPCDQVSAEFVAELERALEVDGRADPPMAERGARERLRRGLRAE